MKKTILSVFIFLTAFFVSYDVNAASTFDVNMSDGGYSVPLPTPYDTEIFNYFEEQKNNTEFYQMLNTYGSDIKSNLFSISGGFPNGYYNISIFTDNEIRDYCSNVDDSSILCSSIPNNFTHVITYNYFPPDSNSNVRYFLRSIDNSLKFSHFYISEASYFFYFNNSTYLSRSVLSNEIYNDLISQYSFSYNWIKSGWWIFGTNSYAGTDFSYLYSKIYDSNYDIFSYGAYFPTINLSKALFNNTGYDIENLSSSYYLDYLKKNSVISSTVPFKSLLSVLNYKQSVEVPNTYSSQYFGYLDNVSLFPKTTCSQNDLALYVYSNANKSFNLYLHEITEEDTLGYQGSYYTIYSTIKDSTIKFNPLNTVYSPDNINQSTGEFLSSTLPISDFIKYSYRFEAYDNKSEYMIYYNPLCYDKSYNYESVTFTNPLTGNDITYDENYANWSDPENVGSANGINFFDNPNNYDLGNLNLTNLGNTAWKGASDFIGAGVEIITLSTVFFDALPDEVSSIILTAFIVGILLLLIGLVKKII